ncbi:PA1571 family protein [Acinetobacter portensis]|uniref:PA1571 family protein n=1 Tax=Acinetobacter portensis TaxID=1839785 RepID=UPI00148F16C1|nr:PA1571 family protein [Acinetobacter portensis]
MSMSKAIVKQGLKVLDSTTKNHSYLVDAEGKEVQITSTMVRNVCHQLLNQCRKIKN